MAACSGLPPAKRQRESPSPSILSRHSSAIDSLESLPYAREILPKVQPAANLVDIFISHVKKKYGAKPVQWDLRWIQPPTQVEYINLACIDRRHIKGKDKEYEEVTKAMVQDGNVDTLQEKKGRIEFSKVAEGIDHPSIAQESDSVGDRRLILVEGAPGVGKSTFAWEFCRKWLKGKVAKQYHLILLLRLRDKRTRDAKDLQQLISHPLPNVSEAMCQALVVSDTFHALIVLDGYDELPDSQRNDSGSFFNELISGELLPFATVLVTSRPWATKDIRKRNECRIFQHIEVLGFTKRQINDYIINTVPNDKVSDLNSYLERHPQIRSGMYIPLNSVIVVAVYDASKNDQKLLPNTLTKLYTSVIKIIIRRHIEGHPEFNVECTKLLPALNIPVPYEVHKNFHHICKLAYDGIVEGNGVKLIFSESELPPNFDNLGFMDSVTELYVTGETSSSHNFLHLTFQEFFAAVRISTLPPEERLLFFKRDFYMDGRFKVVLKFLAGLTKLECITKEALDIEALVPPGDSNFKIYPDLEVGIDIVNWMFEAQNKDTISEMLGENKVGFTADKDDMLLTDYYSLGYCISHIKCQWLLSLTGKRGLSKEKIEMLAEGSGGSVIAGCVIGLDYVTEYQSSNFNNLFVKWKSFLRIQQLSLKLGEKNDIVSCPDFSTLTVLGLDFFSQMGNIHLPLSLCSLTINCISLENCEGRAIADFLSSTTCLKELKLNFSFDEMKMEPICGALANNQDLSLERFEMNCQRGQMNINAYKHLLQFFSNTTKLQYFSIFCSNITLHKLQKIVQSKEPTKRLFQKLGLDTNVANGLQTLKDIVREGTLSDSDKIFDLDQIYHRLGIQHGKTSTDIFPPSNINTEESVAHEDSGVPKLSLSYTFVADLVDALSQNCTFQNLSLSDNQICDRRTVTFIEALTHDSTATKFVVACTWLKGDGTKVLAQSLVENSKVQVLTLSKTCFGDDGVTTLAQTLYHNVILREISLSGLKISDSEAAALAQALRHNSTLQNITLLGLNISDYGTTELIKALTCNSTIKEVSLSLYNFLSTQSCILIQGKAVPQQHNHCALRKFNMSDISITYDLAAALAHLIIHCTSLERFSLTDVEIGDDGVAHIAQGLCKNSTFKAIKFSRIRVGYDGTTALKQMLLFNSALQELIMCDTSLGCSEIAAIAQPIRTNSTLQILTLTNNNIDSVAAVPLAQALQENSSIQKLNLSHNSIANDGAKALAQALQYNSSVQYLTLSSNQIADDGAIALADALQHNSSLQKLILSGNCICSDGAVALAQALPKNSALLTLNLSCNSIFYEGAKALASALYHNYSLQELHLHSNHFANSDKIATEFVQALVCNSIKSEFSCVTLTLNCEKYASQCPEYHKVKHKMRFF